MTTDSRTSGKGNIISSKQQYRKSSKKSKGFFQRLRYECLSNANVGSGGRGLKARLDSEAKIRCEVED